MVRHCGLRCCRHSLKEFPLEASKCRSQNRSPAVVPGVITSLNFIAELQSILHLLICAAGISCVSCMGHLLGVGTWDTLNKAARSPAHTGPTLPRRSDNKQSCNFTYTPTDQHLASKRQLSCFLTPGN